MYSITPGINKTREINPPITSSVFGDRSQKEATIQITTRIIESKLLSYSFVSSSIRRYSLPGRQKRRKKIKEKIKRRIMILKLS
jgi:hypothetical protein